MKADGPLGKHVRARIAAYLATVSRQGSAAAALGLTQQEVSRLKRGAWKNPPLDVLEGVARMFDTTLSRILSEVGAPDRRPAHLLQLYGAIASLDDEGAKLAAPVLDRIAAGGSAGSARTATRGARRTATAAGARRKGGTREA